MKCRRIMFPANIWTKSKYYLVAASTVPSRLGLSNPNGLSPAQNMCCAISAPSGRCPAKELLFEDGGQFI
jgi:hypothetical protein